MPSLTGFNWFQLFAHGYITPFLSGGGGAAAASKQDLAGETDARYVHGLFNLKPIRSAAAASQANVWPASKL